MGMQREAGWPPGILHPAASRRRFRYGRRPPSPDLAHVVAHYWTVAWDLRGQPPFVSEVLGYPCVNLVVERGASGIFGVHTGKFTHRLESAGRVFGVRFRPGAFHALLGAPVAQLTDRSVAVDDVFDVDVETLEATMLSLADEHTAALAERLLRTRAPAPDPVVELVNRVIDAVDADASLTRVSGIAARFGIPERRLQRLFSTYVGASPKWVLMRARLHSAAGQMAQGGALDWPRLATELGYCDQAHFIRDFKAVVGMTPGAYVRRLEAGR